MSLAKNLVGRVWVKPNLGGGGGVNFFLLYSRFVKIPRGPQNLLKNVIFWPKKSKFYSEMPFFSNTSSPPIPP
jgi:hypothetical protein